MSRARAVPRWHMKVPDDQLQQHVPPQLQPLVRGAWLRKAVDSGPQPASCLRWPHNHHHHARFCQLTVDLALLRWGGSRYVLLHLLDSLECDAARLSITLRMLGEPALTLCFEDAPSYAAWATGLQLVQRLLSGAAAVPAHASDGNAPPPHSQEASKGQQQQQSGAADGGVEDDSSSTQYHLLVKSALFALHSGAPGEGIAPPTALANSRRRRCCKDPCAAKLREAQTLAAIVSQRVSSTATTCDRPSQQPSPVAAMAAAAPPLLPHELAGLSSSGEQQEETTDVGQQASQAAMQANQHQAPSDSGSITATPPQQLQHTAAALQASLAQAEQPSSPAAQAGGRQRMLGTFRMPQGLLQRLHLSSQAGDAGLQQVHSYGSSLSSGSSLPPPGSCQSSYGGSSRMLTRISAGATRPSLLGSATTRQHSGPRLTPQKQQQMLWWLSHQQQQGPSTEGGSSDLSAGSSDLSAQPSGSTGQEEDCSGAAPRATTGAAASKTLVPAAGPAHQQQQQQQHVLTRALSMPELSAVTAAAAVAALGGSVRSSLEVSVGSSRRLASTSTGRRSNSGSISTRPTQEVLVVQQGPVCTKDAAAAADPFAAPPQQQVEAAALASSEPGSTALQEEAAEPAGCSKPPVRKLASIKRLFAALADSLTTSSSSGGGGSIGDDVGSSTRGAGRRAAEQGIARVSFAAEAVSQAPRRRSSHSLVQAAPSFSWPFACQQSASGLSRSSTSLTSLPSFSNARSISLRRPSFDTATISAWSEADESSITAGGAGVGRATLEDACVSTDSAAAAAIAAAGSPASAAGLTQHCRARAVAALTPVPSIGAEQQEQVQEQEQQQQQIVMVEPRSPAAAAGAASEADTVAEGADLERPVSMADLWVYLSGQASAGAGSTGKAPAALQEQQQEQEQGQQQRCASPGGEVQQQCPSAWVISTAPDVISTAPVVRSPAGTHLCAAAAAAAAGQPISLHDLAGCSGGCGAHSLRVKLPEQASRGGGSQQSCGLQLGLHQHQHQHHKLWQGEHLDTSSVVKSPAGSHASLHSVFSHTSHASLWMSHDSGSPASRRAASPPPARGFAFGGSGTAGSHCGSSGSMPRLLEGTGSGVDGSGSRAKMCLLRRGLTLQVPVDVMDWRDLALGRALGQGGEAAVLEARYLDAPVAVKLGTSTSEVEMALAAGSHDNLVGLRGLTTKDDGSLCLVLELCSRGTLDKLLHTAGSPLRRALMLPQPPSTSPVRPDRPDLTKLLPLMRSVARGVLHLHTRRPPILHRDIKPANIFLSHGMVVKIGDLGMARQVLPPRPPATSLGSHAHSLLRSLASQDLAHAGLSSASGSGSGSAGGQLLPAGSSPATPKASAARTFTPGVVGTITYTAPEVLGVMDELQQREAQDSVETVLKADSYSLGVTLWEMLEVRRPFEALDSMQLWTQWVSDPSQMVLPPLSVPPEADATERRVLAALQELVTACTAHDAQQRPSVCDVLDSIRQAQRLYVSEAAPAAATCGSSTASVPA